MTKLRRAKVAGRARLPRTGPAPAPEPPKPRLGAGFHRLWWANSVSSIGNGITLAALSLLAATSTSDPIAIAAVFAAYDVPTLVFGIVGAAAIDRIDRRRMLLAMDLGRLVVVVLAGGLILAGAGGVALAYVVSVCVGIGSLLFDVTASAVVADETPPELLGRANSALYAAEDSMRDLVGMAVGAVLFAGAASLPFFVDAGTFAFSAAMVASLRLARTRRRVAATVDAEPEPVRLREGVAYLRNHQVLRRIVALWSVEALLFGATFALLVYYALHALDLTAAGFGLLGAATGAGMLVGNLGASRLVGSRERGYQTVLILIVLIAAVGYIVVAAAGTGAVASVGLFIWGAAIGVGNVATSTLRQRLTPSELFGRVFTVATVCNRSAIVAGAFVGGIAASLGGARVPWILAACVQVVTVVGIMVFLRDDQLTAAIVTAQHDSEAESGSEPDAHPGGGPTGELPA